MATVVSDKHWVEALDLVVGALDGLPLGEVQARCGLARSKFEAVEVRRLAAEVGADGDDRRARKLAGRGERSKASARRAAARAAAVSKNPALADDLESGQLSDEKLDSIADAASGDESAATDDKFIDEIKKRSVDQGRKLARKRKTQAKSGEGEHDKQRRLRNARRWKDSLTGLSVLALSGDDATIEELWNGLSAEEKRLKEADGGRDLAASKHPRTFDQRLFDAAANLIRGAGSGSGLGRVGGGGKPSIVVAVPVDGSGASVVGADGGGHLPDSAVREMLARAEVSVELIDSITGKPLWHGRLKRHATSAQWVAMIVRDGGCALCDAHWARCEAHHMMPWNAPAKGETNIDEMALLCVSCHHDLHAEELTLERLDDGTYKTRPATSDEIAPKRSEHDRQRPRRSECAAAHGEPATTPPPDHERRCGPDNPSLRARPGSRRVASGSVSAGDDDPAA
jgi:hypothetical protein